MTDTPDQHPLLKYVFQGVFALLGLLLTMNSFFIQRMIDDISTNTRQMAEAIKGLEVSTAVVRTQIDTHADRLNKQADRITTNERTIAELNTRVSKLEQRR